MTFCDLDCRRAAAALEKGGEVTYMGMDGDNDRWQGIPERDGEMIQPRERRRRDGRGKRDLTLGIALLRGDEMGYTSNTASYRLPRYKNTSPSCHPTALSASTTHADFQSNRNQSINNTQPSAPSRTATSTGRVLRHPTPTCPIHHPTLLSPEPRSITTTTPLCRLTHPITDATPQHSPVGIPLSGAEAPMVLSRDEAERVHIHRSADGQSYGVS